MRAAQRGFVAGLLLWSLHCQNLAWTPSAGTSSGRREALRTLASTAILCGTDARAEDKPVFRTQREAPEVPKVLSVMLLRTTYEAVEDWGCFKSMAAYQAQFGKLVNNGYQNFKGRYQNYDLRELYNATRLALTRSGGVTNRFYFSFLNDAQFRVIGKAIQRPADRTRFARVVGDRLYRSILKGVELKADVPEGSPAAPNEEEAAFNYIGVWPKIAEPLPKTSDAASVSRGVRSLLQYLKDRGYCDDFEVSDFTGKGGDLVFTSFVKGPANLDATASLMKTNDNFAPRYDQRILQAYLAECGYACEISDRLALGLADSPPAKDSGGYRPPTGVRTLWTLTPDSDAGL